MRLFFTVAAAAVTITSVWAQTPAPEASAPVARTSPAGSGGTAPPAPEPGLGGLAPPRPPHASWDEGLSDAVRNNEAALSLYRQLVERNHAPKEREYQLCQEQRRVLNRLLRASNSSEALAAVNVVPGGAFETPFTIIGD